VEKQWPHLTLIWIYLGSDSKARSEAISSLDYPGVEILIPQATQTLAEICELVSPDTEICAFWADDDKPVGRKFLQDLVNPLTLDGESRAAMHLWAGNALAVPRTALVNARETQLQFVINSFMRLALSFLDVGSAEFGIRSQVFFSSTERLAPLCADPVGRVC
jgi:hypothetical protein